MNYNRYRTRLFFVVVLLLLFWEGGGMERSAILKYVELDQH